MIYFLKKNVVSGVSPLSCTFENMQPSDCTMACSSACLSHCTANSDSVIDNPTCKECDYTCTAFLQFLDECEGTCRGYCEGTEKEK